METETKQEIADVSDLREMLAPIAVWWIDGRKAIHTDTLFALLERYLPEREAKSRARLSLLEGQVETCVAAAVRCSDGTIIRGHQHNDCLRTLYGNIEKIRLGRPEQGFITTRLRFVDRVEGQRLQRAAGIESVRSGGYIRNDLYSEDLY